MPDRLTALDASFLHLEAGGAHMHVAAVLVFDGEPPRLRRAGGRPSRRRLHLVPRYRQRLAYVPLGQGRPVWVDDPHFNARYHIRHTALPAPGTDARAQAARRPAVRPAARPLQAAVGAVARRGPRGRPLRDHLQDPPRARRRRQRRRPHVASCSTPPPTRRRSAAPPSPWIPRPCRATRSCWPTRCSSARRARREIVRGRAAADARAARGRRPSGRRAWRGVGAMAWAGLNPAPPSPLNVPIGPHRRYTWVDADLRSSRRSRTRSAARSTTSC